MNAKELKVIGIVVRLSHKGHEHVLTFVKSQDTGKYEVWIDGKLIRLAGLFSLFGAKKILSKHLNEK